MMFGWARAGRKGYVGFCDLDKWIKRSCSSISIF